MLARDGCTLHGAAAVTASFIRTSAISIALGCGWKILMDKTSVRI